MPIYESGTGLGRVLTVGAQATSIQAAINAAAGLAPTATNPALILIPPGTYTENLTLSPFAFLSSMDPTSGPGATAGYSVIVSGTVGYVAPADSSSYDIAIKGLRITGVTTFNTAANTGAGASALNFIIQNCFFGAALTLTGRAAAVANDTVRPIHSRCTTSTWTDITVIPQGSNFAGTLTIAGASAVTGQSGNRFGTTTLSGTATLTMDSGGGFGGTLTAGTGTTADIRGCKIPTLAQAGTGAINRDVLNGTTGAQVAGAGVVITFAVPFMDANYKVHFTQTAGAAVVDPVVTAQTATTFTITVAVGGGTWDYTVVHD